MLWRSGLAAGVIAVLAAPVADAAKPASLDGTLSGVTLPKAGQGVATVRAMALDSAAIVAAAKVDRHGRYSLKMPAGRYAVLSQIVRRRSVSAPVLSAVVRAKAGKKRRMKLSAKRHRARRKQRSRARRSGINPRDGRTYPGIAVGVKHFEGATGENALMNKGVANMLVTDLSPNRDPPLNPPPPAGCVWTLVEYEQLALVYAEIDLQQTAAVDPDTRVEPGHIISPDFLVEGTVTISGNGPGANLRLDARLVNARTRAVRATATATSSGVNFFAAEEALAKRVRQLICDIQKPPPTACAQAARARSAQVCAPGAPEPPPPPPPDDPNAGSSGYTGSFSGEIVVTTDLGSDKVTWSGSLVLGVSNIAPGGIPGFPAGSYAIYRLRSGFADVHASGTDGTCTYDGSEHVALKSEQEGNLLDQVAVQLETPTPAYSGGVGTGALGPVPIAWSGPPADCSNNAPTLIAPIPAWVYTGPTPLVSTSRTLAGTRPIEHLPFQNYTASSSWQFTPA